MVVQTATAISTETLVASLNHIDIEFIEHLLASNDPVLVLKGNELANNLRTNISNLLTWLDPIRHSSDLDCQASEFADEIFTRLLRMSKAVQLAPLCAEYQELCLEVGDLVHKLSPEYFSPMLEAL